MACDRAPARHEALLHGEAAADRIAGILVGLMGNISLGLSAFWLGVILVIPRLASLVQQEGETSHWGARSAFAAFMKD